MELSSSSLDALTRCECFVRGSGKWGSRTGNNTSRIGSGPVWRLQTPVACFAQTKLNIRPANRRDLMGSSDGAESALTGPAPFFDSHFPTFPSLPIDAQPFDGYETAREAARQDVICMETAKYPTAAGTPDSAAADGDAFHAALSLLPEDVLMEPLLPDDGHDQVHPLASALAAARAACQH